MTRIARLTPSLAVAAALLLVPGAASAARARPRVPSRPQVKVLGFSTFPRVGIPQVQARPGKTLTACHEGYNGQREVNVVWQGWGIPRGTKMGIALWGGSRYTGSETEPSDADTMKPANGGFTWRYRKAEKRRLPYGFSFAGGPFGPLPLDGAWTVKILIKGRVVARKQVTIACR